MDSNKAEMMKELLENFFAESLMPTFIRKANQDTTKRYETGFNMGV